MKVPQEPPPQDIVAKPSGAVNRKMVNFRKFFALTTIAKTGLGNAAQSPHLQVSNKDFDGPKYPNLQD